MFKRHIYAGLWILGTAVLIQAQVPYVFQQGVGGYSGTRDTYFQTGNPSAVRGADTEWEWDGEDAGGINFGLITFDNIFGTGNGQVPPTANIIGATLRLVVTNNGAASQIATMHELLIPFDDQSDLLDFGDGFDPLAGSEYSEDVIVEIPGPPTGAVLELDVTESIQRAQASGTFHGWIFVPGGSDGVGIASSEAAANQPRLTILVEGAAPPSARRILSGASFTKFAPVRITIEVTVPSGSQNVTLTETLPSGWSASNISNGGTFSNGVITWQLNNVSGTTQVTYTAEPSDDTPNNVTFSGLIDGQYLVLGTSSASLLPLESLPQLYRTNNVLAVGVWNDNSGSSDLAVCAELVDSNGEIYVQDTSAVGGWPAGTTFKYKVVFFEDGSGGEEPGWQQRDFDDSSWDSSTDTGFTIGYGGNNAENGETLLIPFEETVYTRSIFDARNYDTIDSITIRVAADDEALVWFNGIFIGFTASGTSDRGETAPNYVWDTTIAGGQGGLESGANPTVYTGGGTKVFTFPVDLVEGTPVNEWTLY